MARHASRVGKQRHSSLAIPLASAALVISAVLIVGVVPASASCDGRRQSSRSIFEASDAVALAHVDGHGEPIRKTGTTVTVVVDEVFKGEVGTSFDVVVLNTTAGSNVPQDGSQAVFTRIGDEPWTIGFCGGGINSVEARALTGTLPEVTSAGPATSLVAGDLGDVTVIATDADNQPLGYGVGTGRLARLVLCPGETTAVGFTDVDTEHRELRVDVFDVRTLRLTRSVTVPNVILEPTNLVCAAADGHRISMVGTPLKPRDPVPVFGIEDDRLIVTDVADGVWVGTDDRGQQLFVEGYDELGWTSVDPWSGVPSSAIPLPVNHDMKTGAISPDGRYLAAVTNTPSAPGDLVVPDHDTLVIMDREALDSPVLVPLNAGWTVRSTWWNGSEVVIGWADGQFLGAYQIFDTSGQAQAPVRPDRSDGSSGGLTAPADRRGPRAPANRVPPAGDRAEPLDVKIPGVVISDALRLTDAPTIDPAAAMPSNLVARPAPNGGVPRSGLGRPGDRSMHHYERVRAGRERGSGARVRSRRRVLWWWC